MNFTKKIYTPVHQSPGATPSPMPPIGLVSTKFFSTTKFFPRPCGDARCYLDSKFKFSKILHQILHHLHKELNIDEIKN